MVTCLTSSGLEDALLLTTMTFLMIGLSVLFRNKEHSIFYALLISYLISILLAFTLFPTILAILSPLC